MAFPASPPKRTLARAPSPYESRTPREVPESESHELDLAAVQRAAGNLAIQRAARAAASPPPPTHASTIPAYVAPSLGASARSPGLERPPPRPAPHETPVSPDDGRMPRGEPQAATAGRAPPLARPAAPPRPTAKTAVVAEAPRHKPTPAEQSSAIAKAQSAQLGHTALLALGAVALAPILGPIALGAAAIAGAAALRSLLTAKKAPPIPEEDLEKEVRAQEEDLTKQFGAREPAPGDKVAPPAQAALARKGAGGGGPRVASSQPSGADRPTAPGPPPGGSARPEMEAWVVSANRDIRSIGPRRLGAAEGAPEMVRRSGGGIRSGRRGAFPGVLADARASVSPAPENAPPPEPLEEIPVKDAAQRIAEKSDRRLPPQTLPALEMTPWGEIPRIVGEPSPPPAATRGKGGTAPGSEARDAPNKRRLEKSRSEAAQKEPEGESGVGEPVVISDVAPPKRRPFPPRLQSNVGAVLAQLLARTDVEARDILTSTRGALYGGVLLGEFPDIGDDLLPELTASLDRELRLIATQAGITKEALDLKIADRQRELLAREQRTREETTAAASEERQQMQDEGQARANEIAGAKETVDRAAERQLEAVGGRADAQVVYAKRDRLEQQTNRQVGAQVVAYEEARKKQASQLDAAAGLQVAAYRATTKRQKDRVLAEAGADPAAIATAQASADVAHRWGEEHVRTVGNVAANAKESAAAHAATYVREIRAVGDDINLELRV